MLSCCVDTFTIWTDLIVEEAPQCEDGEGQGGTEDAEDRGQPDVTEVAREDRAEPPQGQQQGDQHQAVASLPQGPQEQMYYSSNRTRYRDGSILLTYN